MQAAPSRDGWVAAGWGLPPRGWGRPPRGWGRPGPL